MCVTISFMQVTCPPWCACHFACPAIICFSVLQGRPWFYFLLMEGCGGLVSAYGKRKSCCHSQGLMGSLWDEHSIPNLGTLQTGLGWVGMSSGEPWVKSASPRYSSFLLAIPDDCHLPLPGYFFCARAVPGAFSWLVVPSDPPKSPLG